MGVDYKSEKENIGVRASILSSSTFKKVIFAHIYHRPI